MEDAIRRAIEFQAKKLLKRQEKRRFSAKKYQRRWRLRTGTDAKPGTRARPGLWDISPHFDPAYCIKHSRFLSRVIWLKIRNRSYCPSSSVRLSIDKDGGGTREVMVFSIPDAAIANLFYKRLRDKNRNLFSPFSYAYLRDRGLFDAVIQLKSYLIEQKTFIAEFDFSKYFDSIDHKYLDHIIEKDTFNISDTEKFVIGKFLRHPISDAKSYVPNSSFVRTRGVPQGCSLSLFLANIAGHDLDRKLESINGQFVRFADDIVAVTRSHDDAIEILNEFDIHCRFSGISINHKKSRGISIIESGVSSHKRSFFVNDGEGNDLSEVKDFDYIGHKFSPNSLMLSSRGIKRMKRRISKIIYIHLLYTLRSHQLLDKSRIKGDHFDWDLVTCVNEIRSLVYGGLREQQIKSFLENNTKLGRLRGFIAFCPLITSIDQFRAIDGWMVDVIRRALSERYRLARELKILGKKNSKAAPSKTALIDGSWYNGKAKSTLELGLPSFSLAWRASRKQYIQYGLAEFENPRYYSSIGGFTSSRDLYDD